jgi:hypothetical protein
MFLLFVLKVLSFKQHFNFDSIVKLLRTWTEKENYEMMMM